MNGIHGEGYTLKMAAHDSERCLKSVGTYTARKEAAEYEQGRAAKGIHPMSILFAALITLPMIVTKHFV